MQTFSYGATPEEVIREAAPHKYPMELNRSDLLTVLAALGGDVPDEHAENAAGLRTSILTTLNIEEI